MNDLMWALYWIDVLSSLGYNQYFGDKDASLPRM